MSRLALGLLLALAFLTGCGGDDNGDEGGSSPPAAQTDGSTHETAVDDVSCRELKQLQRRLEVAGDLADEYIPLEARTTLVPSFAAVLNAACEGANPDTKPVPGIVEAADVARRRALNGGVLFNDALFEETSEQGDAGDEGGAEPAVGDGCEPSDERVEPAAFAAAFKKEAGVKLGSDRSSAYVSLDTLSTDAAQDKFGASTVYVLRKVDPTLEIFTQDDDGKPIEPDAEGIYWEPPSAGGTWSATKVCASNVVVVWAAGDEKRTDDRWDRLSAAVAKAIDAAGS